jgi:hypothetical protein
MPVSKKLLDRFRAAFKRYGAEVLGDPDITSHFFASEFETHIEVVLGSPKFQNLGFSEEYDSIWNFLRRDPALSKDDLFQVSSIHTVPEAVEFI